MCVCTCVCVCVCVKALEFMRALTRNYANVSARLTHTRTHTHTRTRHAHTYSFTHFRARAHTHTHTHRLAYLSMAGEVGYCWAKRPRPRRGRRLFRRLCVESARGVRRGLPERDWNLPTKSKALEYALGRRRVYYMPRIAESLEYATWKCFSGKG